ncbi:pentapeptide repeat-containing protein [Actinomadura geliboluensis]|uniref:Pentapeptide repeat-containing protein n=1 Tax=Actinomadura geliboluensis TaxID=882440 RepID=A0A5S4GFA4_9ACTN|nr:pentapeptide repeat-containing protein [Actinomadura geliboluensis]TMR24830.1 pentapeptide repeat-containing protein [Actinomadura geliboluensis]
MGGVYALQRLMKDSPDDRSTIRSVLAAYVRTHAQDNPSGSDKPSGPVPPGLDRTRLAVDVEAALTTVAASPPANGRDPLDLHNVDFHHRHLAYKALTSANLDGAALGNTDLRQTNLTTAFLNGGDLHNADLRGAILDNAALKGRGPAQLTAAGG